MTNRRKTKNSINPIALVILGVVLIAAIVGVCLMIGDCKGKNKITNTESAIKVMPTPKEDKKPAEETEPGTTINDETEPPAESTGPAETDPSETDVPEDPSVKQTAEPTLDQLISVVGWALTDTDPDGFHYKYFSDKSTQTLAKAVIKLAAQGKLGLPVRVQGTDDPNQVMLSSEELNAALSSMVRDAALKDGQSSGTLIQIGSGWAMTPSDESIELPHTAVTGETESDSGNRVLTVVLVQPTDEGETVLQTAEVEVAAINGGFGYQIQSWITGDVPRFSRNNVGDTVTLKSNSNQFVSAVEITWSQDVTGAVLKVGTHEETLSGKAGRTDVIVLESAQILTDLTLTVNDPNAVSAIKAY